MERLRIKTISEDEFYLPSYVELGGQNAGESNKGTDEGELLMFFETEGNRKVYNNESELWARNHWSTRTPMKGATTSIAAVYGALHPNMYGDLYYYGTSNGSLGVRPLCNVDKNALVIKSDYTDDEDNQYYELYTPTISIDSNISMTVGDSIILNADVTLEGAEVKWQVSSSDGTITLEENGVSANITANKIGEVTVTVSLVDYPDIKAECIISITDRQIDVPSKPSNPSRPSSPSKDLPSNTEECQNEFGKDYIYSKELDACIIKYLVVDTSTK